MRPVIIIGAGIAGLSAAIALAEQGQKSVLVSTMPSERAQSVMAEGGINAALDTKGQGDSPEEHFRDTIRSGCGLSNPTAVRALTEGAPALVRALAALGVPFHRTRTGEIDLRYFGGQKKQRTAFAQSSTGKQITAALIQEARKWEGRGLIARRPRHMLVELTVDGQERCTGCILLEETTKALEPLAEPVLLASGGLNGLFGKTTGTTQNTGAATAAAFAAGAACANLEMIQYHPTTTPISGKRALISEAARGEGGRLFVLRGGARWYYMEERYPELGNLMPRDVVARETEQACRETGQKTAFLDMSGVSETAFAEKLSDLRQFCLEFLKLDPVRQPIPGLPRHPLFHGRTVCGRGAPHHAPAALCCGGVCLPVPRGKPAGRKLPFGCGVRRPPGGPGPFWKRGRTMQSCRQTAQRCSRPWRPWKNGRSAAPVLPRKNAWRKS